MDFRKILTSVFILCSVLFVAAQNNAQTFIYKQLQDDGWHRNEIKSILSNSANLLQPISNNEAITDMEQFQKGLDSYTKNYETFHKSFPEVSSTSEIIEAEKVYRNKVIARQRGLWKHVPMYSTAGRIYDLELHPEDKNSMYANPDGDGIFKTSDGGITWIAISDNIPNRLHRNSYENIIVDPADFHHVFSISRFGKMYETKNAGESWTLVSNNEHEEGRAPQFKWVEAFRNASEQLILIGTVTKKMGLNHGWNKGVYRSVDGGSSWKQIIIEDENFQEIALHKSDKDFIYLVNQSKLYVSANSGETFELRKDFEYGDRPAFLTTLFGDDADALYVALSKGNNTQVHYSADKGLTWEVRQDAENNLGFKKGIFGGRGAGGWLGFFEVDPFDKKHLIAASVATCESFDGGKNWEMQSWSKRAEAQKSDGTRGMAPYGSHNADSHVLKFHPKTKGFKVKGCDAGILMKEKADTNWVNINGNMPAFLWYSVVVNEFGDRYIAGNTQDVNVQTYRYNSWENDRGYEGDAIFMNPSTNTSYYPVAKTEEGEGLNFLEPGFWKMHSWSYPKVAVNYKNLDQVYIAFGRRPTEPEKQLPKYLYVSNNRGISFNRVPNMSDKEVFSVNVSRTEKPALTAFTESEVMISFDEGKTWETNKYPEEFKGTQKKRKVSGCVNPNNPKQIWVGADKGQVLSSIDGGKTWENISGSLPEGHIVELLYHEGTKGDLYALVKGYGVFYRSANASDWKLWMNGFNLADFTEIRIDYPAQKLLASSYGRGLWEADLEQTVERFGAENFSVSAKGKRNGRYVFSLESGLQIPAYYNYTWFKNGEEVGANLPILQLHKVKEGDKVELELNPIYSSEVSRKLSCSVTNSKKYSLNKENGSSLFLNDKFIDLGVVDLFGESHSFTFSTWIKPITAGVIAANRRTFYRDAKGWYLEVTQNGKLNFNAAFWQNRTLEKTFNNGADQSVMVSSSDSVIEFNKWIHLSVTVDRKGAIKLFVNNKEVANETNLEIQTAQSLNNVFNFTLLADSYGKKQMIGEIREVAIFNSALSNHELEIAIKKGLEKPDGLVYYLNFQNSAPLRTSEFFTNTVIQLKGEEYLDNNKLK